MSGVMCALAPVSAIQGDEFGRVAMNACVGGKNEPVVVAYHLRHRSAV